MEVGKVTCILVLVTLVFANNFWEINGKGLFITDFLKWFGDKYSVFISADEIDEDLVIANKNTTTHEIRYTNNKDEEQVSDYLQKLHLADELKIVVFVDSGHHKLLGLLINELQLFNKGLTGLVTEADVSSGPNRRLRLDTRLYYYGPQGNTTILKEIYALNGEDKVKTVGKWQESTGLLVPHTNMWDRRANLEGMLITVATKGWPSFMDLSYDESGESIIRGSGLFLEPMNILAREMNFTLKLIPSDDGEWGSLSENGTWNGLIRMLIDNKADIAGVSFYVSEARARVVTASRAIADGILTLVSASTTEPDANPWIYVEIMPKTAWYIICGMVISFSTCFVMIDNSGISCLHDKFDSEKFSMMNGLGLSLTFFRQIYYNNVNVNCRSTRVLFILSALSTYLLYIHYTAYLTATSTYNKKIKIKSFRDVLEGGYRVSVIENTAQHDVLKFARPGTAMHEVYHKTMNNRPTAFVQSSEIPDILAQKKTLFYGIDIELTHLKDLNVFSIQGLLQEPLLKVRN